VENCSRLRGREINEGLVDLKGRVKFEGNFIIK
jgi:hypothetical protein